MKKILLLALLCSLPALAQDERPQIQVFGGFSHMGHHIGLNGWIAGAEYDPWEHLGLEGQLSGHYGSDNILGVNISEHLYDFNFGPRFFTNTSRDKLGVFGHALFGGSHISSSGFGVSESDQAFSFVLGGGAEYTLSDRWAARGQIDFVRVYFSGANENDGRYSIGLVYRWSR